MRNQQNWNDSLEEIATINTTPFVDILLVLLVIFMITAPIITQNIQVDLPTESINNSSQIENVEFVVIIRADGKIMQEKQVLNNQALFAKARQWVVGNPNGLAFVQADKKVSYGRVVEIMANLQRAGIEQVGLVIREP